MFESSEGSAGGQPWWVRAADPDLTEADLADLDLDDWDERDADPDYRGPLHDALERLAVTAPEPDTAAVLAGIDPRTLDDDERLLWLRAVDRVASWVSSLTDHGLLAAAGPRVRQQWAGHDAQGRRLLLDDVAREEIALATGWSPAHAHARITSARRLAALLPTTAAALAAGDVDPLRARIVADHAGRLLTGLPDAADPTSAGPCPTLVEVAVDLADRLESRVLPVARRATAGRLRAACERAVVTLDPQGAQARAQRARRDRDCGVTPLPDGQALWWARVDAATAVACQRRVENVAADMRRRWADDATTSARPPTAGEWRAEAATALLLGRAADADGAGADATAPTPGAASASIPVRVDVVIDLPTLLGLAENPAELVGHGPVPPETARTMVALGDDVTWRRLVADPVTGHLLDEGRRSYRVPDRLRRWLARRDATCRFPGCSRRADTVGIDVDHAVAWHDGGRTDRSNLGALCRRHHLLKTHASWRLLDSRDDGSCTWTSPHGLTHHRAAPPLLDGVPPAPRAQPTGPDPPPF